MQTSFHGLEYMPTTGSTANENAGATYSLFNLTKLFKLLTKSSLLSVPRKASIAQNYQQTTLTKRLVKETYPMNNLDILTGYGLLNCYVFLFDGCVR